MIPALNFLPLMAKKHYLRETAHFLTISWLAGSR
jgi:hypothetical protein